MNSLDTFLYELGIHPERVRLICYGLSAALSLLAIYGIWQGISAVRSYRGRYTWHYTMRMMGWLFPAVNAGMIILLLLITASQPTVEPFRYLRYLTIVPFVTPILIAVESALLFSPTDDPAIELLLTYPRPLAWLVTERVAMMLGIQLSIGMVGSAAAALLAGNAHLIDLLIDWLPATIFVTGIGLRITIGSRQIVFGVLAAVMAWGAFGAEGSAMLMRAPYLWPLQLYAADHLSGGDYLINRLVIVLIGIGMLIWALRPLQNAELILTGKSH